MSALAELKINHAKVQQSDKMPLMARSSTGGFKLRTNQSPPGRLNPNQIQQESNNFETRSEFQGNRLRKNMNSHVEGARFKTKQFEVDRPRKIWGDRDGLGGSRVVGGLRNEFKDSFDDVHETRTIGGGVTRTKRF